MPNVSECMTHEVFAVAPDTSVEVAGRLLYAKHISGLPVVDARGAALGVVTAKDLVDPDRRRGADLGTSTIYRLAAGRCEKLDGGAVKSPGKVGDVMTTFVVAVPPSIGCDDAMRLMAADDIHRLLVVDDDKQVIGIFSAMDALRSAIAR